MTDPPPITQDGATVVVRGPGLPLLYRATLALIQRAPGRAGGFAAVAAGPRVLDRATMSQQRHEDAPAPAPGSRSPGQDGSPISVAEAADLWVEQAADAKARGHRYWRPPRSLDLGAGPAVLALAHERREHDDD